MKVFRFEIMKTQKFFWKLTFTQFTYFNRNSLHNNSKKTPSKVLERPHLGLPTTASREVMNTVLQALTVIT